MLEKIEFTLIGESPLLMHNGQLADPTNEWTRAIKEVAKKRNKTDADLEQLRKLEWMGGLYLNADNRPAIPADNILACVIEGARKSKNGKDAQAGVFETEPFYDLTYDGPKDPEKLYATKGFCDYRNVRVQRNRVMRARARFSTWSVAVQLLINTDVINVAQVLEAIEAAGVRLGLCDYRPRHGRFRMGEIR